MKHHTATNKLPRNFYLDDPVVIAPKLLGKIFIRKLENIILAGKIVEVEAYRGINDPAAHSYNGKTNRNEIMFGEGGYLYVYFTYGMHFCSNVVTGPRDDGSAILIRALEPLKGIETMLSNRFGDKHITEKEKRNIANGPAKICSAFDIARKENGIDLTGDSIFLMDAPQIESNKIVMTQRIGIKKAVDYKWRFYIKDNPYVSKK